MSVIKGSKSIKREDMPAEVPDWVNYLLEPLNGFMDTVITALRNGINHSDNMRASLRKYTFTDQVELEISHSFNGRVGVQVLYCEDYYKVSTRLIDNDTIGVTFKFDSAGTQGVTFAIVADIKVGE